MYSFNIFFNQPNLFSLQRKPNDKKMQSPFAINKKLIFKRLSLFSVFTVIHHFSGDPNQNGTIDSMFSGDSVAAAKNVSFLPVFYESFTEEDFFVLFRLFSGVSPL